MECPIWFILIPPPTMAQPLAPRLAAAIRTKNNHGISTGTERKAEKEKAFYDSVIYDSIALFGEKPVVL